MKTVTPRDVVATPDFGMKLSLPWRVFFIVMLAVQITLCSAIFVVGLIVRIWWLIAVVFFCLR